MINTENFYKRPIYTYYNFHVKRPITKVNHVRLCDV
jgi:hypothetical protein